MSNDTPTPEQLRQLADELEDRQSDDGKHDRMESAPKEVPDDWTGREVLDYEPVNGGYVLLIDRTSIRVVDGTCEVPGIMKISNLIEAIETIANRNGLEVELP